MICERCAAEIRGLPPYPRSIHAGHRLFLFEQRLLQILWDRRGRWVTLETLMMLLYDGDGPESDHALRVYVCRIRPTLGSGPWKIESGERGSKSYRLIKR